MADIEFEKPSHIENEIENHDVNQSENPAENPAENLEANASVEIAEEAVSERSSRLQELARLVAKTVSERKTELTDMQTDAELADGTMLSDQPEPEQMGFEALEEELDAADNDADPEPTEFVENDQLISIVESLLFSTDKPVSLATLKSLFKGTNVRTKDIARALDILASEYASATRGVTLEEINGGYQLRTKVDNTDFLKRLQKVRPFRLSGPALEAMSIVAYKQPVTKYEIDEIRGVESGHLLRALMERGLVQFQGKAEDKPGKPMAYGSTRKFLETFGLRNLRELPTLSEIDELLPEGIGEVEEKEKLSDITDELSSEFSGGYSESEEELSKINETLQAIDTSSEFFEQEKVRERERRDRDRAQDIRERIVLGDSVDPKDQRWLDRYEAKLHAEANAPMTGEPGTVSEADIAATEPIGDALEALTNEIGAKDASLSEVARDDHEALTNVDAELSGDNEDGEDVGFKETSLDWSDDDESSDEDTSNDV
jgi:segregation and condensation protein B